MMEVQKKEGEACACNNDKGCGCTTKPQKYTYEQLENIAHQMSEQSRVLYQQLQDANMTNVLKRLEFLFKVIEFQDRFDEDFVSNCVKEIQETMTLPEEEEVKEEPKE